MRGVTDGRRMRLRRGLVVLSALLAGWASIIAVTGGVSLRIAGVGISSRAPRNPLILSLAAALAAWFMAPRAGRGGAAAADWSWLLAMVWSRIRRVWRPIAAAESALLHRVPDWAAPLAAAAVALTVVVIGFVEGALVAAGADAWGYVSQADLWLSGSLRLEQPLMRELSARIPPALMAPLAYTASPARMDLVPAVGPGLPMLMALAALAGGREAVFYVVPVAAGIAIGAAYVIGKRIAGRWAGVATAVLLATSPAFLFQLTSSPMSDIPVTAWWGVALAALIGGTLRPDGGSTERDPPCTVTRAAAVVGGAAAGLALLTRPNLLPLAAGLGVVLAWRALAARIRGGPDMRRVLGYAAGVVPAALIVGALNTYWHGSPLSSGYGAAANLFSWSNIGPNLARYPVWLVESQTAVVLLAFAAPFVLRRRQASVALLGFAVSVLACYVVYAPFDVWWYLRFLLPAYPPLLALAAGTMTTMAGRLPSGTRLLTVFLIIGLVAYHGFEYARARATFSSEGEYKYAIAGRYVAEHLPPRAMVFAMQHSGSVRYYSGHPTLRWDLTPVEAFEWAIGEIEGHGYAPFAVVEDWEDELWRQRFVGQPLPRALTRPPIATLPLGNVRVYDLGSQ
jgi:hypothetical protein